MKIIKRSTKQAVVISELNYLMVKHNQSISHKEIVFNRVNDAFRRGCSPAKGFAIGLRDASYLIKRGV